MIWKIASAPLWVSAAFVLWFAARAAIWAIRSREFGMGGTAAYLFLLAASFFLGIGAWMVS